jgi:hypothetical protein
VGTPTNLRLTSVLNFGSLLHQLIFRNRRGTDGLHGPGVWTSTVKFAPLRHLTLHTFLHTERRTCSDMKTYSSQDRKRVPAARPGSGRGTYEYVGDVIEIDEDGDVMLRTVADGDMVTFPRRFVQANFVAAKR